MCSRKLRVPASCLAEDSPCLLSLAPPWSTAPLGGPPVRPWRPKQRWVCLARKSLPRTSDILVGQLTQPPGRILSAPACRLAQSHKLQSCIAFFLVPFCLCHHCPKLVACTSLFYQPSIHLYAHKQARCSRSGQLAHLGCNQAGR